MAERIGVCSGCQSKFKIPESFKGVKAKCKKCGGVVEIPPAEAEAPKAEAPAPAEKPAAAPAKPKVGGKSRMSRGPKAGARPRGRARRSKNSEKEKSNNMMLLIVGGVALVIIIVMAVMFMGGEEEKPPENVVTTVEPTDEPEITDEEIEDPSETEVMEPEEKPEEVVKKEPEVKEPEKTTLDDPVLSFEKFPAIEGGDPERFEHLTSCLMDGFILEDLPRRKRKKLYQEFQDAYNNGEPDIIPVVLNAFHGLDLSDREGVVLAFKMTEKWNKFTGKDFCNAPVRGDCTEEALEANQVWNFKAINSIMKIWRSKLGDQEAQEKFFATCEKQRAAQDAKDAKEARDD